MSLGVMSSYDIQSNMNVAEPDNNSSMNYFSGIILNLKLSYTFKIVFFTINKL